MFTIIVVSYNNKDLIGRTLNSLLNQNFKEYELVVIDGGSSDGSLDEFNNYKLLFPNFYLISEPDDGIYDAMNKGVKYASGDYIYFLNLGDAFFNNDVLLNVSQIIKKNYMYAIYYGNIVWGEQVINYPRKLSMIYFLFERMVCHQAIFASKSYLLNYPFDITLRLCADRDWLTRIIREGALYKKIDIIIAKYDINGASSNYNRYNVDSIRAIRKSFGVLGVIIVKVKRFFGKILRSIKHVCSNKFD